MLIPILLMGGLGLIVGVGLAIASKVFYVYVDPKILAVDEVLPGANCGGCGFPGCSSNAEAIVAGKSPANSCVAAGPEVAEAIAAVLGVSIEAKEPDIALPGCTYGVADAETKYVYDGMNDCRAAALLGGGMKVCHIGCLGLGTCASVCPFDAIVMGKNGLPIVDESRCTGCGTCERACPKHIIQLSSVTRRIIKEYTAEDCTTPCQRACPAGINISGYIGAIAEGDNDKAVRIIKERNPFPTVIGRICPRPCENDCRRQYVDEPVAINFLKRYAADQEMAAGKHVLPSKAPDSGRRVAVIGGGIEGLSAAFFAARLGHSVTVYEASTQLGGLLRSAIARYRLPMKVLDWDIEGIVEMGVNVETKRQLGVDLTVSGLLGEGYQTVFLAVGGWDSRLARTGGRGEASPVPGSHLLIDVAKAGTSGYPEVKLSGHVVVVGNTNISPAIIARCKELGAQEITLLVREPGMIGIDGVQAQVIVDSAVNLIYGQGDTLKGIEVIDLPTREKRKLDTDHVIFASGRMPELIFAPIASATEERAGEGGSEQSQGGGLWEAVAPYKQPGYQHESGLLAEGDHLTDIQAAIKAIGAGRRAAVSIHNVMYGLPLSLPESVVTAGTPIQNVFAVSNVSEHPRTLMPLTDEARQVDGIELEKGFSAEQAKTEADRCLQCGLICYLHGADRLNAAADDKAATSA